MPSASAGMVLERRKTCHERVRVVAVVLVDCSNASLHMWKWEEGMRTHGKYICIFAIECTGEVHGLSSWEALCLNKCQRAQKLVPRAEDKIREAERCVYMYVCCCVREREILAQVQSWNSLGFPIPAVVVTAFLVHLVSTRVVFSFHCIISDAS